MSEPIVAITGMGVISSLASSLEQHWPRLLQGTTGIRELGEASLPRALRCAGRVDDDALPADTPPEVLKQGRLISPSSRLGLRAVGIDLADHAVALRVARTLPGRLAGVERPRRTVVEHGLQREDVAREVAVELRQVLAVADRHVHAARGAGAIEARPQAAVLRNGCLRVKRGDDQGRKRDPPHAPTLQACNQ